MCAEVLRSSADCGGPRLGRRRFLQLAAASGVLAAGHAPGGVAGAGEPLRLQGFVYDVSRPYSAAIARAMAARGVRTFATCGSLTALWQNFLHEGWKTAPMPLAGATDYESLFTLEVLALDFGMRVVLRGTHLELAQGVVAHEITAPPAALVASGLAGDAPWHQSLARALTSVRTGSEVAGSLRIGADALRAGSPRGGGESPLYSWIIAPRGLLAARA